MVWNPAGLFRIQKMENVDDLALQSLIKDTDASAGTTEGVVNFRGRGCTFLHCVMDVGTGSIPQSWQSVRHFPMISASLP